MVIILVTVIATPSIAAPETKTLPGGFTESTTFTIQQFTQMEVRRPVQVLYSRDEGETVSFYLRTVPKLDIPGAPAGNTALDTFKFEATAEDSGMKFLSFCADIGAVGVRGSYVIDMTDHGFNKEQMHTLVAVIDFLYDKYGFGSGDEYSEGIALVQLVLWNLIIRYTDGPLIADSWIRNSNDFWLYSDEFGSIYKIEGYNNTNGSRYWYTPEYKALINDILADTEKYVGIYDKKLSAATPYETYIREAVFLVGDRSHDAIYQQRQLILLSDEFPFVPPEPEKISISGVKEWKNDTISNRPDEITVLLLRDGVEIDRQTVRAPWTFKFEGLDKYTAEGEHEYAYAVDEIVPTGYTKSIEGTTITNTYSGDGPDDPQKTSISGSKIWDDGNYADRPAEITLLLLRDGTEFRRQTVSAPWTFEFTGLDKFSADGEHEYAYAVDEIVPAGYTKSVEGTTITNTYRGDGPDDPQKTSISGSKVWNDGNYAGRPTEITVLLLRDGVEIDRQTVRAPWTFEFTGLNKYSAEGEHEYTYTVDEIVPTGYTKSIAGTTITNSRSVTPYIPPVITTTSPSTPPDQETVTPNVPPVETDTPEDTDITIIDDGPPLVDFDPDPVKPPPDADEEFFDIPDDDVPLEEMPVTGVESVSIQLALLGLVILLAGVQSNQRRKRGAK